MLTEWLDDDLLTRFKDNILSIDTDVMLVWGELTADLEVRGKKMPAIDSLIAAIAIRGKLSLVTRNESDFRHTNVAIINPWKG